MHWKNTENHTENFSLLFKYWSLHFANHTEKLLITLKKYCAVLQCNHVENHLRWKRWISVLIIGKRLNTENALKYLWKIFRVTQFLCVGQFSWIFRVTLKFSVWFSVLKFHSDSTFHCHYIHQNHFCFTKFASLICMYSHPAEILILITLLHIDVCVNCMIFYSTLCFYRTLYFVRCCPAP